MKKGKHLRILAIGAHADDIELGCGGTIAKAIKSGHSVKMIIMTESAYTNYDGKVLRTAAEVTNEVKGAAKALGVPLSDVTVLTFPNKDVPYDSSTVQTLNKILDDYRPDLILTHWAFDTHQDHRNTALSTISAARYYNNILMYEPFPPSGRSYVAYKPQIYTDISETMKEKIDSVKAHKSQVRKYGKLTWIDSIKGRASLRGFECGVKYAETFEIVRYMQDL